MADQINYVSKVSLQDLVYLLKDEEARELIADILDKELKLEAELNNKLSEVKAGFGLKVSQKESGYQVIELDDSSVMILDGGTAEEAANGYSIDEVVYLFSAGTALDLF